MASAFLMVGDTPRRPRPLKAVKSPEANRDGPRVHVSPIVLNGLAVLVMGVWAFNYIRGTSTVTGDAIAIIVATAIFGGQFIKWPWSKP